LCALQGTLTWERESPANRQGNRWWDGKGYPCEVDSESRNYRRSCLLRSIPPLLTGTKTVATPNCPR